MLASVKVFMFGIYIGFFFYHILIVSNSFFFFKQKTAYEMRISDLEFRRVLFRSPDYLLCLVATRPACRRQRPLPANACGLRSLPALPILQVNRVPSDGPQSKSLFKGLTDEPHHAVREPAPAGLRRHGKDPRAPFKGQ